MRWEGLFADLEAQLAQGHWQDTEAEAAEMTRGERAGITLADRIRGALGATLQIQLAEGDRLEMRRDGALRDVIADRFGFQLAAVTPHATWWYDHVHPEDRERQQQDFHD